MSFKNIRTAQDSDVEPIVPAKFRSFNFRRCSTDTKNTKFPPYENRYNYERKRIESVNKSETYQLTHYTFISCTQKAYKPYLTT